MNVQIFFIPEMHFHIAQMKAAFSKHDFHICHIFMSCTALISNRLCHETSHGDSGWRTSALIIDLELKRFLFKCRVHLFHQAVNLILLIQQLAVLLHQRCE